MIFFYFYLFKEMIKFKLQKNRKNDYEYIINGNTLLFIKFLHEHKEIIKNMIQNKPRKVNIKKFFKYLKKLVLYEFTTEEFNLKIPQDYVSNIIADILNYQYGKNFNLIDILEKNMSKEYLYSNFELWWYQSMYMLGGSGYIRNINDYLNTFWDFKENLYTEEECNLKIKLSYSHHKVPQIFSDEELKKLEDFVYFYSNPPFLYETNYINDDLNYFSMEGRIF